MYPKWRVTEEKDGRIVQVFIENQDDSIALHVRSYSGGLRQERKIAKRITKLLMEASFGDTELEEYRG